MALLRRFCISAVNVPKIISSCCNILSPAGEAKTAVSESSFKCCKGDRIRVSLNTNVKSGAVNFVLYNSKGGVVENFGTAKAYRGFVDLELDDTYTLVAEYSGLEGDFKAEKRCQYCSEQYGRRY